MCLMEKLHNFLDNKSLVLVITVIFLLFSCLVTSDYFANLGTVAPQAPLSMGLPRLEFWNGLPFSSPGDLPDAEIESVSPSLAGGFFTTEPSGKSGDNFTWFHVKSFLNSVIASASIKCSIQCLSTINNPYTFSHLSCQAGRECC